MSDNFSSHSSSEAPTDDQLMTSWARISLDFGETGIEVASDDTSAESEPTDQLRREIQDMIGAIRKAAQSNSDGQADPHELAQDLELTEEIFQKMLEDSNDSVDIPESELATEETVEEDPSALAPDGEDFELTPEMLDPEIERRILEASSDDVVQAILLAAVDRPEIIVYEADEHHVDLYVLTIELENDSLVTAHLGEDGKIRPGVDFEEFAADFMEELPTRGGLCATQDSYSYSAPVTVLGEELTLDADAEVAALIELEMPEVPLLVVDSLTVGPVDVVPVDNGWSLISCDPVSMLHLLQNLTTPAIVAESTEHSQHLTFVVPGASEKTSEPQGDWSEWMNSVVGTPVPDDTDSGAIINLVWGPEKKQTRYLPRDSFALDTLWLLPGILPDPLNFVQMNDAIESLTWYFGLDETASKRLRNYVESSDSELGLESVLQLLGLPAELSKVAQGRVDMDSLPGHRQLAPNMSTAKVMSESVTAYPNGRDLGSQINRAMRRRPWIFTADGLAQLGISGLLVLAASRKLSRGESARAQAVLAAILAGSGVSEIALGRAYMKLKNLDNMSGARERLPQDARSIVEELEDGASPAEHANKKSGLADRLSSLSKEAQKFSKIQIRKFFGEKP